MNYDNDGEVEGWAWQGLNSSLADNTNAAAEVSKSLVPASDQREGHVGCTFDVTTTPLKSCSGLSHHLHGNGIHGKEIEQDMEPCSQLKRRRMLHFEPDFLDASLCNNEVYLRSKEKVDSFEDNMADISDWVSVFADETDLVSDEHLDPSAERWIDDCFNDDMIAPGASAVQNDVSGPCGNLFEHDANAVEKLPVHTTQNITLKGKKSYMRTPPKLASSIIYPFTFIKPCAAHGDMTLKDINQRLHTPKSSKTEQDASLSYPTSAFSGKPVVGKTKIRTEGGEGSITIVRTKG